jgi:hypothetical protein
MEELRLRVLKNRVLRRIFGTNREEVAGGCRILHNEELHNLYASPSITRTIESRRIIMEGNISCMGEMRNS